MSIIARSVPSEVGNRTSDAEQLLRAMVEARSPAVVPAEAVSGAAVRVAAAVSTVARTAPGSSRMRLSFLVITELLLGGRNRYAGTALTQLCRSILVTLRVITCAVRNTG